MDDPGGKFWFKLAGLFVVGAIALFIFLIIFVKAVFAWGFLGVFLVMALIALVFGYFIDKRNTNQLS
jgi:hypothetical protein